jgi:4-alpha-glucanotransferase
MKTTEKAKQEKEDKKIKDVRNAGILLHLTSLPSAFGIGDMGPEARLFADFLFRNKQRYWQLLPLSPIEKAQAYSPYSSTSSMAGNILLISPELLKEDGLLNEADLKRNVVKNSGKVKYEDAEQIKTALFDKAFSKFKNQDKALNRQFEMFCDDEKAWLNDFAIYTVIKQQYKKPWYEWSDDFKQRKKQALDQFASMNKEQIEKEKWLQFIFTRQWEQLRFYCNQLNVSLYGDLPFYVSYDSVDVWANPEFFALDENKNIAGVAGVPPDYFNADGQLWGMPVFNWDTLKANNYAWWIKRLKKNIELYDVIRLDHFRAFADYWEVSAREKTARNGKWQPGPGADFFHIAKKQLMKLPFVAEDLGDINEGVHKLREQFSFPGMKVLQFAFGDKVGDSDYIPHNYTPDFIAYTGTHDNNTTVGWYRKDLTAKDRKVLTQFLGRSITQGNVHIELARLAYTSIAKTVIVPMQDILGLDETTRINTPASVKNNWLWRLKPDQLKIPRTEARLQLWSTIYNRK